MTNPGKYHLTIYQGADLDITFTWKDTDDTPIDLTGYSAALQVRKKKDATTTEVALTQAAGITLGGAAGTIQVEMSATDTAALDFKTGFWDLELTSGGGVVTRLLEGGCTLSKEVTRAS